MKRLVRVRPEFVEFMPRTPAPGILYVAIRFNSAMHLCCCGCGHHVVTPLAPLQWQLTYNGRDVSLYPSIGNWSYPCRSHYWIEENRVEWAPAWNEYRIASGRYATRHAPHAGFISGAADRDDNAAPEVPQRPTNSPRVDFGHTPSDLRPTMAADDSQSSIERIAKSAP